MKEHADWWTVTDTTMNPQAPIPDPHETGPANSGAVMDTAAGWIWRNMWWLVPVAFAAGYINEEVSQWIEPYAVHFSP